jgi:hypothetical protein
MSFLNDPDQLQSAIDSLRADIDAALASGAKLGDRFVMDWQDSLGDMQRRLEELTCCMTYSTR